MRFELHVSTRTDTIQRTFETPEKAIDFLKKFIASVPESYLGHVLYAVERRVVHSGGTPFYTAFEPLVPQKLLPENC